MGESMRRFALFDRWGAYVRDLADVVSATHSDTLNGADVLTIAAPGEFVQGQRIVWRDDALEWHEHVVTGIVEDRSGSGRPIPTLTCYSSIIELEQDYIVERKPSGSAARGVEAALSESRWVVGNVDVAGSNACVLYHMSAYKALSKVVETWGGEIHASITVEPSQGVIRRAVDLLAHRGGTTSTRRFDYSADLKSIKRTVDESAVITALYVWGKGEQLDSGGYGRRVGIEGVTPDGLPYVHDDAALNLWGRGDGQHSFGELVLEQIDDPHTLLAQGMAYLGQHNAPLVSYDATVEQFGAAGVDVSSVMVGDQVDVVDHAFATPLRLSARVVKVDRDLLTGKTAKVTLGNILPTSATEHAKLASSVMSLSDRSAAWDAVQTASESYIDNVIDTMNAMFAAGGSYVTFSTQEGITVMDADTFEDATSAMNISGMGFRIANSKVEGTWNWRTFGTGNGFFADFIVAGLLAAGKIQSADGLSWWDLDHNEIRLSPTTSIGGTRTMGQIISDIDAAATDFEIEFAQNQSQTEPPDEDDPSWSTERPTKEEGYYTWQRAVMTTAGGQVYSDAVCVSGVDGEDGDKGDTGIGIKNAVPQFYLSTSDTSTTGGQWSADEPAWQEGKFMWFRYQMTWTNDAVTYTTAALAKAYNSIGKIAVESGESATKYITDVDQYGIKIHPESSTDDYALIDGSGLEVFKDNTSIAKFGATSRVGTTSGARVVTTSNGIDIYNSLNEKKASYGSTQYIYGGAGTYPYLQANSTGVYLYQNANNHANVTSSGLEVFQGGASAALFGATARIGQAAKQRIYMDSDSIDIYDANNKLAQQMTANGTTMYTAGTKRALYNATGMTLYATNGTTVAAEFKDAEVNLGKNANTSVINMCAGKAKVAYDSSVGAQFYSADNATYIGSSSYANASKNSSWMVLAPKSLGIAHYDTSGYGVQLTHAQGAATSGLGFSLLTTKSGKSVSMTGIFGLLGALAVSTDYHFIPIGGDKYLFFKQTSETFDITTSFGSMYYTTISNQGSTIFTTANGKGPIYNLQVAISASTGLIWAMPMIASDRRSYGYRVISATSVTSRACQVMIMGVCGHASE